MYYETFYKLIEDKFVRYPFNKLKVGDVIKTGYLKQRYKIVKIKKANETITCKNLHSECFGGKFNELRQEVYDGSKRSF